MLRGSDSLVQQARMTKKADAEGVQNSVSVGFTERCVSPVSRQNVSPVVTRSGSSFAQGASSARRPSVYPRRAA